jgi:hypothetical protein
VTEITWVWIADVLHGMAVPRRAHHGTPRLSQEESDGPMPEKHVLRNALAKRKQQPAKQLTARQPAPPMAAEPVRGKGRPPGKRSDPDYQPTTVLLRHQTKKMANRLLEDGNTRQDLSELIEQLLVEWIQQSLRNNSAGEELNMLPVRSLHKERTGKHR